MSLSNLIGAERAPLPDHLAVVPRAHGEEDFVVPGILGLDRPVDRGRSVNVLLVPEAVDEHDRHLQGLLREELVHGLLPPVRVVTRVGQDLPPEAELLHAAAPAELARVDRRHVRVVVVVGIGKPEGLVLARGLLVVDEPHALLAERAVVEPVIADPAVDHRVHGHRALEGRVRIEQRHQRQKAVVGDPDRADPAVRLGDVFDEPVDRVPGVGRMIDVAGVERAAQRPVDHVVPLGPVLAAHVLEDPDVAVLDDDVRRVVVSVEHRAEVRARDVARQSLGVVGCPGQEQTGSPFRRGLRHQDDGVELHPVAHGDVHDAPVVVPALRDRDELLRHLARQRPGPGGRRRLRRLGVESRRRGEQQDRHRGTYADPSHSSSSSNRKERDVRRLDPTLPRPAQTS